jgi:hypothetical protein
MLPIPLKVVKAGVRDMVRISDARMSGRRTAPASSTSFPLQLTGQTKAT